MRSLKTAGLAAIAAACLCAAPLKNAYVLSKDYTVTIHGTSNLHAWDEKVGAVSGDGIVSLNGDGTCDINAITIKMEVRSIKSDMGGIMNNNTYKALKADEHPQIIFTLGAPLKALQPNAGERTVLVKGSLSIAGITRPVTMQVKTGMQDGRLLFEGAQAILMTDYGIKPPTAMLGTLKTGNGITIDFKTSFTAK